LPFSLGALKEFFDKHPNADKGSLHVVFQSADGLTASIPFRKAMSSYGDTLVAYEMNGVPIPPEHGAPLRVIVPGHVGVRNVKWLTSIAISPEEAPGTWQRGIAYKGFGPSTLTTNNLEVAKIQSLQEMGVQSAITVPDAYAHPTFSPGPQTLKGYAYSGGGRGIVRVDVSIDNGKTWKTATLKEGSEQPMDRAWAWTFWECDVDVPSDVSSVTLVCKATDASYNVQPDSVEGIWNLRGINNNAWHRVEVHVQP
jgi:sulfite oxidase